MSSVYGKKHQELILDQAVKHLRKHKSTSPAFTLHTKAELTQ